MRVRHCHLLLGGTVGALLFISMLLLSELSLPHDVTEEHSNSKNLTRWMIQEAEVDNGIRLRHVEEVCWRHNLGLYRHSSIKSKIKHPPTPQYGVFYIDRPHKLSWCPLYKAASTTWLYNLCLLGGYSEEFLASSTEQLSVLARRIYPETDFAAAEEAFQSTLKLIVVRHPFERLLSAYRDKLENSVAGKEHGTEHYYRKYGQHIVAKYRPGGIATSTKSLLKPGQYWWDPGQPRPAGTEPTFHEFIRYLIDTDLVNYADDHWIPYYLFCTPCLLKYDIIAKVETLLRDQVYTLRATGLESLLHPRWIHSTAHNHSLAHRYFSQLRPEQVQRLYAKYELDFELFDYSPEDYIKYATSNVYQHE